jgi:tetratricopeptide (TPR) repeat protein
MAHISRNQPCPCGSGKKYKGCCGKKDRESSPLSDEEVKNLPPLPAGKTGYLLLEDDDVVKPDGQGGHFLFTKRDQLANQVLDLIRAKELDEAERISRELIRDYPEDATGLRRLARVCEARGDKAAAAEHFEKALELLRKSGDCHPDIIGALEETIDRLRRL